MKTIKTILTIALFSVILCGCSKKSTTPPHLVAVPKNAFFVAAFDAKQIVNKAGLNKMNQFKFYSTLEREFNNLPAENAKTIKDFLKNTRSSGLNLDRIFVYASPEHNALGFSAGFTFEIDNLKTFEKFIDATELASYREGNKIILPYDETTNIEWNDNILVISTNPTNINIFNSDEKESILANEIFKTEYEKSNNDVCLFVDFNGFIHLAEKYTDDEELQQFQQYKDFSIFANITTEKGSIVSTFKGFPEEKVSEIYGKFYKQDFDNIDIYKYFPEKSLFAMKFAVKPLDFYSEYKKNIGIVTDENQTETTEEETEDYYMYSRYNNYNDAIKYYIEQHDAEITSVLSCFTGDLLASFVGMTDQFQPEYAIAAGILEGKESDVISLIEKAGFKKNDNYYTLNNGIDVHFAINNNVAYLTGSTEYISNFFGKAYNSNITSAKDYGKELKNSPSYFYWNININDYPSILKMYTNMSEEGRMAMPLLEKLKSISAKMNNAGEGEMRLDLTDNSEYATKTILNGIDDLLAKYFEF